MRAINGAFKKKKERKRERAKAEQEAAEIDRACFFVRGEMISREIRTATLEVKFEVKEIPACLYRLYIRQNHLCGDAIMSYVIF